MLELNKIYCTDCIEGLKQLNNECIDLSLQSPPYGNIRKYEGKSLWDFNIFQQATKELYRVTKPGGMCVWIVADQTIDGGESGTSFEQALYFKNIGFTLHDTMIYQKNSYPFPPVNRYYQVFEYMFCLSKGKPKTTNILRCPTLEANRIKNKKSNYRVVNGETIPMKYETGKETRKRDNVWKYEVGYMKSTKDKIAFKHPATFPERLAEDHILSWSNPGDIILDIFAGSATTLKIAKLLGRNYIGFEINPNYVAIAEERLKNLKNQEKNVDKLINNEDNKNTIKL